MLVKLLIDCEYFNPNLDEFLKLINLKLES